MEDGLIIPKFHLENSTRKWGVIKSEVLSINCTKEDAKYLKYLFAEASSQNLFNKWLFVPSGIHLMEGKEVMHGLLTEHNEFVDTLTSFMVS